MTLYEQAISGTLDWSSVTSEMLSERDDSDESFFHFAARFKKLNEIPIHLFTSEALDKKDVSGLSVWCYIATYGGIKHVPKHFVNSELLTLTVANKDSLFNKADTKYIIDVLNIDGRLNSFVRAHPALANDIQLRDPRLLVNDACDNNVVFLFDGTDVEVKLNRKGVFIHRVNHKTLSHAVSFIESSYESVEKSIPLSRCNSLAVGEFVL